MKKLLVLTCLNLLFFVACKSEDKEPVIDQRDSNIGTYVCDVKVENYKTSTILRAYVDTLVITKFGIKDMQLASTKKIQLPTLQILQANGYYGLFTVLRFEKDELIMTSGPDSAFYEYRGYKIK